MSDLGTRVSDSRRRLLDAAEEVCALLVRDVRQYPDRELERRFLGRPAAAAQLDEARLNELRRRSTAAGEALAAQLGESLGDPEAWLALAACDGLPPEGKDLREVTPIWRRIADIVDPAIEALAGAYGLGGDDRDPAGYPPPRRFIDRRYLPALAEAVLREIATLRRLQDDQGAMAAAERTQSLAERWAAAGSGESSA
jgi:hypothetical protein